MTVATRCPVTAYAEDVLSGRVLASRWVRLAAERHLRDLDEAHQRGLHWDPRPLERFERLCSHLRQSKGRWALEPLQLLDWQRFVVGQLLGWKREDGTRRFRRAYVEVARKNGKTTLAAALAIWLLDFDNEPGAEVYVAATHRQQARQCWDEAHQMVQRSPALARRIKAVPSRAHLWVPETASRCAALGADADTLDGLNPHAVIVDELHAHRTSALVDRLETSMGARRQPVMVYITTAGESPVYRETREYSERVLAGVVDDDAWLALVAALDPEDDWTDPSLYRKANPSLGVTVSLEELVRERDRALAAPGRQWAFRTYRLNQVTAGGAGWIDLAEWDACADPSLTLADLRGGPVWAGLDLAATRDTTALVLVAPRQDRWLVWEEIWIPADTAREREREDGLPWQAWADEGWVRMTSGRTTDYAAVRARLRELVDDHGLDICELAFDRWNATQLVGELEADGLTCVPQGMGFATLSMPMREAERLILERRLRHRGSPAMRWQVASVVTASDPAGNVKPDRDASRGRIDAVVAMLLALERAVRHAAAAVRRSVYESRGLSWL